MPGSKPYHASGHQPVYLYDWIISNYWCFSSSIPGRQILVDQLHLQHIGGSGPSDRHTGRDDGHIPLFQIAHPLAG